MRLLITRTAILNFEILGLKIKIVLNVENGVTHSGLDGNPSPLDLGFRNWGLGLDN